MTILPLYAIIVAVILFMINYLSMRLNRIEDNLPKKIKYWSDKMSRKTINEIVHWMEEILKKSDLDNEQKDVFNSALREYRGAIYDITIMKLILIVALISVFFQVFKG